MVAVRKLLPRSAHLERHLPYVARSREGMILTDPEGKSKPGFESNAGYNLCSSHFFVFLWWTYYMTYDEESALVTFHG